MILGGLVMLVGLILGNWKSNVPQQRAEAQAIENLVSG